MPTDSYSAFRAEAITHLTLSSIIYGMKIKSSDNLDHHQLKAVENKFLDEIASDID